MEKFEYHTDAGHGWVKVPKKLLVELGVSKDISVYSYQNGDFAYIEEDGDATLLIEAYQKRFGKFNYEDIWDGDNSNIRNFQTYDEEVN